VSSFIISVFFVFIFIHKTSFRKDSKIKTYKEMKFSHDRVSADLFDYIITEKWILDSSKVKELYDELYKKRESLCII